MFSSTSTPRKNLFSSGGSANNESPLIKKPRFDLLLDNTTDATGGPGVLDMSGIEEPPQELVVSNEDLFLFQLQNAFQGLSDQINRVGTHLAQKIESLQSTVNQIAKETTNCRKRAFDQSSNMTNGSFIDDSAIEGDGEKNHQRCSDCHLIFVSSPEKTITAVPKLPLLVRCRYCLRRRFRKHASLMDHIRREHDQRKRKQLPTATAVRPYICAFCSTAFRSAALCQKHVLSGLCNNNKR